MPERDYIDADFEEIEPPVRDTEHDPFTGLSYAIGCVIMTAFAFWAFPHLLAFNKALLFGG